MKTDLEIAQENTLLDITEIAERYAIEEDELELYGKYKAKLSPEVYEKRKEKKDGKLVLVTAINPTPLGEGKTTVTVGLTDALNCRSPGAESRTLLRDQGRCSRRRICPSGSDGGSESPFHGRFPCDYFCKQSAFRSAR